MDQLARKVKKIKKNIDDSFRARNIARGLGDTPNSTCSTGQMVSVDYFALTDLIKFYEETKEAASRVMIARDALEHAYWSREPLPKTAK